MLSAGAGQVLCIFGSSQWVEAQETNCLANGESADYAYAHDCVTAMPPAS